MNDDYEERVRQDWYYTYKTWDAADDRRRLERENETSRLGIEGTRLGRAIGRSERVRELQERIDRFLLNKKNALCQIDVFDASVVPVSDKIEWRQQLERIDARSPEAKLELESLLAKVRTFRSAWIEAEKFRTAIESRHLDPLQAEQKRRGEKTRNDCLISSLKAMESSLNLLVTLCEAVQRYV
jgi:hypothetical protein